MTPERTRVWIVSLSVAAAASYGLIRWFTPPEVALIDTRSARQDNEIRNVEMRIYSDLGQPNLVLISPKITSPRRSDEYLIATPLFDVVNKNGSRWRGESKVGRLDVGEDRLWLQDQVVLKGAKPDGKPVTIKSERIEFGIEDRIASSDEAVQILSTGSELKGVGMRADLKNDRFILRSQVEGEYVAKRKRS